MAQIPYTPFPTVSPRAPGTPPVNIGTSPDAFGANIGRGIEALGGAESHVGDELFQRAVAFQELRNETEAKAADASYIMESGKLHDKYMTSEGKNAVGGLDGHIAELQAMRQRFRDGLSNDQARRYFDASSLGTMAWNVRHASDYAARQQKQYSIDTSNAVLKANANAVLQNPKDEQAYKTGLNNLYKETEHQAGLGGWSPEKKAEFFAEGKSRLIAERVEGKAREEPQAAKQLLDSHKSDFTPDDYRRVSAIVDRQLYTTYSRNLSDDAQTGRGNYYGAGVIPIERAKDAIAHLESGGEAKPYQARTDSKTPHGEALGKYQVMEDELQGQLKDAGLPAMDKEAFLKNPEAQEQLFSVAFGKSMNKYGSFNEAAAHWIGLGPKGDRYGTTAAIYVNKANARLAETASEEEKVNQVRSRADKLAPNDPLVGDYAANRARADDAHIRTEKHNAELDAKQTVYEGLVSGGAGGKPVASLEELLAKPEVAAAFNKMSAPQQLQTWGKIQAIQNAVSRQNNEAREKQLLGMRARNPEEFLGVDMTEDKLLNASTMKSMIAMQKEIRSKPLEQDPHVSSALALLKPELNALNLSEKGDKNRYYQFVGTLQDAMVEEIKRNNGRPLDVEQKQDIGRRLLQDDVKHWFSPNEQMFERQIPSEDLEKRRVNWIKQHPDEPAPSEEVLHREFIKDIYKNLYIKSDKK